MIGSEFFFFLPKTDFTLYVKQPDVILQDIFHDVIRRQNCFSAVSLPLLVWDEIHINLLKIAWENAKLKTVIGWIFGMWAFFFRKRNWIGPQ